MALAVEAAPPVIFPDPARLRHERKVAVILEFQMNSLTTVEMAEPGLWRICNRTDDSLFSGEVELHVKVPALDIRKARLDVKRDVLGLAPDLANASNNLIGVRVGPGMTKIVRAVAGGPDGSDRMAELTLEAMEMLINALTVPELKKQMETGGESVNLEWDGPKIRLNNVLIGEETAKRMADNPRLKDSCAAFSNL